MAEGFSLSERKMAVAKLARVTRFMIRVISILFPMTFAWLSFHNVSLSDVADVFSTSRANDLIWKTTIFIYFSSWILGASSDVNDQENIYQVGHRSGFPIGAVPVVLLIVGCGMALIWLQTYEMFSVVLGLFMCSYYLGWRYLVRLLAPIIAESRTIYMKENDIIGAERVTAVEHYIVGNWQLHRFLCGGFLVIAFLAVSAFKYFGVQPVAGFDATVWQAARSISMLAFVLIMDTWLWTMRARTKATLSALGRLGRLYDLKPRAQLAT
jgi:hypothetical protein